MNEITFTHCPTCGSQQPPENQMPPNVPRRCLLIECNACRAAKWLRVCPPQFRSLDRQRYPLPRKLDEVLSWHYQSRGLLLHGETGTGKTRAAWALLHREHMAGRKCLGISAQALDVELPALFAESAAAAGRRIRTWMRTDILLLDDPFKAKLTDRVEETLFEIFDDRGANCRPTILTCNDTRSVLLPRLSSDRGIALVRRLDDYFQRITFS